jgi:hypothetical protein
MIDLSSYTSLLSIGYGTFQYCELLTTVILPSSLTSIGDNTFYFSYSLTSVTFTGLSIPTIGNLCFSDIGLPSTVYYYYGTSNAYLLDGLFTYYVILNSPIPCFKEGSKILTNKGYVLIENLRNGDLVKTLRDDFKPIVMIGKSKINHYHSSNRSKNILYSCSKNKYPEIFEPLIITGCRSILVDNLTREQNEKVIEVNGDIFGTEGKYRLPVCVDERASIYDIQGIYTIYHLALENEDYYMNYGIYANGLLVESCSKRYLNELSNMELIV